MTKKGICGIAALGLTVAIAAVALRPSAPADELALYRAELIESGDALESALRSGKAEMMEADALSAEINSVLRHPSARLGL